MKKLIMTAAFAALLLLLPAFADAKENMQIVYDYITQTLGYNRAVACGIMSNIQYESNFRPEAIGDGGSAYGICQWNSRRQSLINYCEKNGFESWQDIYGQLGYMSYELENNKKSVGAYLKTLSDTPEGAYLAGYYFCVYYEIPSNRFKKGVTRGTTAVKKYFTMYGGTYETYEIKYNLLGGSGSFPSQTKIEGVPLTIYDSAPIKPASAFSGWSAESDGVNADYAPGDAYTPNKSATLYAVWTPCVYDDIEYIFTESGCEVASYHGSSASISIPESVNGQTVYAVNEEAFAGVNEAVVYVPDSVTVIAEGAFDASVRIAAFPGSKAHVYALESGLSYIAVYPEDSLRFGKELTIIGEGAFDGTEAVYADFSQSSLKRIESGAFSGCEGLKAIVLPASVSYISQSAIPYGATIVAPKGSYAESFALDYGYAYLPES